VDAAARKGQPHQVLRVLAADEQGCLVLLQPLDVAWLHQRSEQQQGALWLMASQEKPVIAKLVLRGGGLATKEYQLRKAVVNGSMQHPHIVQLLAVGHVGMRANDGESLKSVACLLMGQGDTVAGVVSQVRGLQV
jgi:hypothetical protein